MWQSERESHGSYRRQNSRRRPEDHLPLTCVVVALLALVAAVVQGQQRGGSPHADGVAPVNAGANPFRVIRDWARLSSGRPWGGSNGVAVDVDGKSVWATDRCSAATTPGCLGSSFAPVHKFDESGAEVARFGADMFVWPHGIHVDRDGNVWVTDARAPTPDEIARFPEARSKGSVVVKFSPAGRVLLTLGTPGVKGDPPNALTEPTDVVTDPRNGDVYVAESHSDVTSAHLVGRISVFDQSGRFLRSFGTAGTGPGQFRTPHALEFDAKGQLIVADRHNHRIQIVTRDGQFVAEYATFSRVSGLAIERGEVIYAADSESSAQVHPGWQRGIRVGGLWDGVVTEFIPAHRTDSADGAMGEGIALDAAGNVFTAESTLRGVTKYVRN